MVKNVNGDIYSDLITSSRPEVFWAGGERPLSAIKYIVIHGTAGTTTQAVWNTWRKGSNYQASAHYVVHKTEIIGAIGENYVAWHSGGTGAITNYNSIGVEHVNSYIGNYSDASTYLFDQVTLEHGAKLVAELCKRYGLRPDRSVIKKHGEVSATSCPQTLNIDNYVAMVQRFYNGGTATKTPAQATTASASKSRGVLNMKIIIFNDAMGDFVKGGHYLFNFNRGTYNYIANTEELKFIKKAYKENNGIDIPEERVGKTYPAHIRYIEGFNLVNADKK